MCSKHQRARLLSHLKIETICAASSYAPRASRSRPRSFRTHRNIQSICALCQTALEVDVEITLKMEAGVDDGVTPLEFAPVMLKTGARQTLH